MNAGGGFDSQLISLVVWSNLLGLGLVDFGRPCLSLSIEYLLWFWIAWDDTSAVITVKSSCAFFGMDYLPCWRSVWFVRCISITREGETGNSLMVHVIHVCSTITFLLLAAWVRSASWYCTSRGVQESLGVYSFNHWLFTDLQAHSLGVYEFNVLYCI